MTLRANSETRVLLVEDDLLLAMDMEDFLVDQGYQVVGPFGRLAQALQALSGQPVDLAIVDLNLAGELSFPLIDTLRRRETPIIVCSGYAELPEQTRVRGRAWGALECIEDRIKRLDTLQERFACGRADWGLFRDGNGHCRGVRNRPGAILEGVRKCVRADKGG